MKINQQKQRFLNLGLWNILVIIALLPFILSCQTGAKALYGELGKSSDPVPFMENARAGVLPSGLRYYILENSMPRGRAFLTLAVDAGSVLETDDEQGLAHFVEHMAFNGTERFPEAELINYLRSLGMRWGPEVNAYTNFDRTVYGIEVPVETGSRRVPDTALAVIDDWTRAVTFLPKDVDEERLVILEEHRIYLGASERMRRQLMPLLLRGSPYAERDPIGLPEIIESAPAERLAGFYKKWYRPDNMALIFVGDFDAALLESSLNEHFHIAPVQEPLNRPRYTLPEPRKGSLETLIMTDPEFPQTRVDIYFKMKSELPRKDLSGYRDEIITYLVGAMLGFRFDEAESNPQTPYMWGGVGNARYGYGSRFYILAAQAKEGRSRAVLEELLTVKESLSRYGFTQAEVDMAKRVLVSYIEQQAAEKDRQNSHYYIDAFTDYFLEGGSLPDIEWERRAVNLLLPGITVKDINRAVKNYVAEDDLTVIITAPETEKASLPTEDEIRGLVSSVKKAKIAPPVSTVVSGGILDEAPAPGRILSETVDAETGAVQWELSNGMRVILKETANKNNEISLYALARGGTMSFLSESPDPKKRYVSASLAFEMMNASGLGPYSRPELVKKLAGKQVSFSLWASPFLRGFQGSAASGDLKVLLESIYLGFTEARLDPDAVANLLDQTRTRLVQSREDPDRFFWDEFTKSMYGNPLFHPLEAEDLEKADMDEALEFIRRSQNPSDYTMVFIGSLKTGETRSLVETYLASIPAKETAFNEWTDIDFLRPGKLQKTVQKGKEERSVVYMGWFMPAVYSEEASASAEALAEYLNITLDDEIRESLGGVYSIAAHVSLSPLPHDELFGALYFACDPGRAAELSAAAEAQIRQLAQGHVDADILSKSREALVKVHEQSVQSNYTIAQSYANSSVIYHSPLSRLDKRPDLYRSVSAEDLQTTAARLLEGGPVHLTLYPEGWITP